MSLPPRLARWETELQAAALMFRLDPLLLAAIMDRESLGGDALHPPGPTGKGDHGRGHGLMQIDIGAHPAFLAATGPDGAPLWMRAAWNVMYGAAVLAHAMHALDGDTPAAVAAYNCGVGRARQALMAHGNPEDRAARIAVLDQVTTRNSPQDIGYTADVLRRRASYLDDLDPSPPAV